MIIQYKNLKKAVLIMLIVGSAGLDISAGGKRPGIFDRIFNWLNNKKKEEIKPLIEEQVEFPVIDKPVLTEDKVSLTNDYIDYKVTQSVEQITNHINNVVANLERKIEALQVEAVAGKKAAIKRKKAANMRKISSCISEEVSKQLAKS